MSDCTCPVCHEDIVPSNTGRAEMSCGHAYHLKCIADWLNTGADTCPLCRKVASDLEKPTKVAKSKSTKSDAELLLALVDSILPQANIIPWYHSNIIEPIMNGREIDNLIGPNRIQ